MGLYLIHRDMSHVHGGNHIHGGNMREAQRRKNMKSPKNCPYSKSWQIEIWKLARDFFLNMAKVCEIIDNVTEKYGDVTNNPEYLYDRAYAGIKPLISAKL